MPEHAAWNGFNLDLAQRQQLHLCEATDLRLCEGDVINGALIKRRDAGVDFRRRESKREGASVV